VPPVALKLFPFLAWRSRVTARTLRMDAIAGLVGALVVLPQGVAYATLAGLPPQYGLYCAIVPAIVAALWGSSWHQISGPTNAMALVVFATMAPLAAPWSAAYIQLVLTLALLVGSWRTIPALRLRLWVGLLLAVELLQIAVGLWQARLGLPIVLVNIHMVLAVMLIAAMTVVVMHLKLPVTAADRPAVATPVAAARTPVSGHS